MTIDQFLENYHFRWNREIQGEINLVITTEIIKRSDNQIVVAGVKTSHDITEMSQLISDSNTLISLMPLDWEKIIDQTKRLQIDYFAQRIPINDFYSLNTSDNPSIANLYI